MKNIAIVGLNHISADIETREYLSKRFYDSSNLLELKEKLQTDDLVILSTCNRLEFIFSDNDINASFKLLQQFLIDGYSALADDFDKIFYHKIDLEALEHIYTVASGLNSVALGESQILGQLKEAFEFSLQEKCSTKLFVNLYQNFIKCAKEVQHKSNINHGSMSLSYVALQLANNIFDSLYDKNVLIIGAGKMSKLAARHFYDAKINKLTIANRTNRKDEFEMEVDFISIADIATNLSNYDIIISATSSPDFVLTKKQIAPIVKFDLTKELFIIDIASPRDVEPIVNKYNNVYLYNIDDLKKIIDQNKKYKEKCIAQAKVIIKDHLEKYQAEQGMLHVGSVIKSLQENATLIRDEELKKLFVKYDSLDEQTKKDITRTMDLLINKLLYNPIISMKEEVKKDEDSKVLKLFKKFFNL